MATNKQPGFEPPGTAIRLKFTDVDWAGAEVLCVADMPLGIILGFSKWTDKAGQNLSGTELTEFAEAMRKFGDEVVVEWNLTHKGEPRPATGEGVLGLGIVDEMRLLTAWFEGIQDAIPLALAQSKSWTRSANGGAKPRARSSRKVAA